MGNTANSASKTTKSPVTVELPVVIPPATCLFCSFAADWRDSGSGAGTVCVGVQGTACDARKRPLIDAREASRSRSPPTEDN